MLQEHVSSALTAIGQSVLQTGHSVQVINPGANLKYFLFSPEKPVDVGFWLSATSILCKRLALILPHHLLMKA